MIIIYLLFSSEEAVEAFTSESNALRPDGEEELGIFQVLDRLEEIIDTMTSKWVTL